MDDADKQYSAENRGKKSSISISGEEPLPFFLPPPSPFVASFLRITLNASCGTGYTYVIPPHGNITIHYNNSQGSEPSKVGFCPLS